MKIFCFIIMFFLFLVTPALQVQAQSSTSATTTVTFDTTDFPQWAKDMRRWDIIAFGSFPFSMFTVTFFSDVFRWADANKMDFSEAGRRYAPWPLKSAGAVEMTKEEYQRTILIAAGVSAVIAFTDLIIVKIRQNKERRRIESKPSGSVIINKTAYEIDDDAVDTGETGKIGKTDGIDDEPDNIDNLK